MKGSKRTFLGSMLALPLGLAAMATVSGTRGKAVAATADDASLQKLVAAQQLTDARQQITEAVYRYARGWDRRDEDAVLSCFHADATYQHGPFNGKAHEIQSANLKATASVKHMTHMITNVMIDIVGDKAVSECYLFAHHRRARKDGTPGEEDWLLKGRYIDRFEKRDGQWKIAHRRGLHDWARTFAPADASFDALPAEQVSADKPADPLYAMLAELHAGG